MKKYIKISVLVLMIAIAINSCTKQLDLAPVSSLSDASYWKTSDQVDAFVSGIEQAFRNNTMSFELLGNYVLMFSALIPVPVPPLPVKLLKVLKIFGTIRWMETIRE